MEENLDYDMFFRSPKAWIDVNINNDSDSVITQESCENDIIENYKLTMYVRSIMNVLFENGDFETLTLNEMRDCFMNSPYLMSLLPKLLIIHIMTCFVGFPDFYIKKTAHIIKIFRSKERLGYTYKELVDCFNCN